MSSVAGYSLLFASVLSSLIVFYAMKILHNNSDELYFSKRGISFLWILCFVVAINTLLSLPFAIIDDHLDILTKYKNTVSTARLLLSYFIFFGQTNVLLFRLFFLTVQVKRSSAISASTRKQLPNASASELASRSGTSARETNSADQNKGVSTAHNVEQPKWHGFFGSERKMAGLIVGAWTLEYLYVAAFTIDLFSMEEDVRFQLRFLSQVVLLLALGVLVLLAYKQKVLRFNDHWYIRRELSIILKILLLTYVIIVLVVVVAQGESLISSIVGTATNLIYSLCLVYVSIIWVHKKNKRENKNITTTKLASETVRLQTSLMNLNSMSTQYSEDAKRKSLDMLANHQVSRLQYFWDQTYDEENHYANVSKEFDAFFNHCVCEFTIENLLYCVHVVQFIEFLGGSWMQGETIDVLLKDHVKLPLKAAYKLSHHVGDIDVIAEFKYKCSANMAEEQSSYQVFVVFFNHLYEKFILREKAPLELNIGDSLRLEFEAMYAKTCQDHLASKDDKDTSVIINIWKLINGAADDAFFLAQQSFDRWNHKRLK